MALEKVPKFGVAKKWNEFVEEKGLKSGGHVQLWSFKKDDEFEASCLCLVRNDLSQDS